MYELRCDVHINMRNVANWAALAGGLLGKANLDGFASAFDRTDMDTIHDELVTQAIQDARRQADVMAPAGGRRVGSADRARRTSTASNCWQPDLKLRQPVDVIFRQRI